MNKEFDKYMQCWENWFKCFPNPRYKLSEFRETYLNASPKDRSILTKEIETSLTSALALVRKSNAN